MTEQEDLLVLVKKQKELISKQEKAIKDLQEKRKETASGFGRYFADSRYYANMPDNPFSHQFQLLHRPHKDIKEFGDLLSPDVLLGNVKDSRSLKFFQNDIIFLTNFFAMSKRKGTSPAAVRELFDTLYWAWVGEVRMTATMGGRERDLQSFLTPEVVSPGFGFPFGKKTKKKKRTMMDYVIPEGEEPIYD